MWCLCGSTHAVKGTIKKVTFAVNEVWIGFPAVYRPYRYTGIPLLLRKVLIPFIPVLTV